MSCPARPQNPPRLILSEHAARVSGVLPRAAIVFRTHESRSPTRSCPMPRPALSRSPILGTTAARRAALLSVLLGLASAGAAMAQTYPDIEAAAVITDRHVTQFDKDTIGRYGGYMVFNVRIGWKGPDERPDTEPSVRVMKFLARCDAKELAVASVAVFDKQQMLVKSFGIAPGGWDWEAPAQDSERFGWMKRVCAHPLAW
jgi:hypothetical protein